MEVDELHDLLDLLVEARLHNVGVLHEVIALKKVVYTLYRYDLRVLIDILLEVKSILLCFL